MEQVVNADLSNSSSASLKPSEDVLRKSQVPMFSGFQPSHADLQMYPIMYPSLVPGLFPLQSQEQSDQGPGIYAVPVHPSMGPMAGLPPNILIPLTYNIPTRQNPAGVIGEGQSQEAQQHGPQRQVVVRRFQFAIQLDLFLILKLAAVVFVFNQDGSRQRLILLFLFASLVYLYQTGALAPFVRWLRQAAAPPQPRPAVRPENGHPAGHDNGIAPPSEGNPGAEDQNQPTENEGRPAVENENPPEAGRGNGVNWWGVAKEIQMFVVGFVTSLFPGFHNND